MPENRFFSKKPLEINSDVQIKEDEFKHIKILRVQPGDLVELVNGNGRLAKAKLIEISKSLALFKIKEVFDEKPPTKKLILAQSLIKSSKLDYLIEKVTEIGVDEIVIFASQNSEFKFLSDNKKKRLEALIISATKQSGRLYLPKITYLETLKSFKFPKSNLYGSLKKDAISLLKLPKETNDLSTTVFIGPEKGFTKDEISYLDNDLKAKPTTFSANILRAETAGAVAISILALQSKENG